MKHYPTVLSVAGSDSSGGAGIQADIKTCTALGCYAMTAITALTSQNTTGVKSIFNTSQFLKAQLDAVLEDIVPDSMKIGMLPDEKSVKEVTAAIVGWGVKNVVFDPVMASTSGKELSSSDTVHAMCKFLLPHISVLTPNVPEAEVLTWHEIKNVHDMECAAREISDRYNVRSVLVKGGHLCGGSSDVFYNALTDSVTFYHGEFVNTYNTHGTGCTLSSAIACGLAMKMPIEEAIDYAKRFITAAVKEGSGYRLGCGHGPVNHLYNIINNPIQ